MDAKLENHLVETILEKMTVVERESLLHRLRDSICLGCGNLLPSYCDCDMGADDMDSWVVDARAAYENNQDK